MITSKDNDLIKHIKSLNQKKYRDEYNEFFIEGIKMVEEAIEQKIDIKFIMICEELLPNNVETGNYKVEYVNKRVFEYLSDTVSPQGILAVIEKKRNVINDADIIFALDDVQDPGNVGTIIRTLDCAGINDLIVSEGSGDIYNPKVVRSTMGAIYRVNVELTNDFLETIKQKQKKGYKIIVTTLDADKKYTDLEFGSKCIVIIGNESKGIRREIQDIADIKVKIPMYGKTESLNASVAGSIIAYEYARKRHNK